MRSLTIVALFFFSMVTVAALPAGAQPTSANTTTYRVRPGDTLWSLARRFGTTPDRLAVLNGISTNATLRIGRPLRVPVASGSSPVAARAAAPARRPATAVYHVQAGETLWRISRRFKTTPEHLAALNRIPAAAILRIGQPLRVPVITAPVRPVAAAPAPAVQSPPSAAATDPAGPASASPDQDPAVVQELLAPEPAAQPPASGAPAAQTAPVPPAANPSMVSPQRPRITPLPSRGAQWMTAVVGLSKRHLGAPYRWGGRSPNGFDCSGFLNYIFEQTGIDLPRTTFAMFTAGTPVPNDQLQAGDVLFFQTVSAGPSHAGVYLGDGRFIHVSSGQSRVTISAMADPYYTARYLGARRY